MLFPDGSVAHKPRTFYYPNLLNLNDIVLDKE